MIFCAEAVCGRAFEIVDANLCLLVKPHFSVIATTNGKTSILSKGFIRMTIRSKYPKVFAYGP
jgi:hypothetical protein